MVFARKDGATMERETLGNMLEAVNSEWMDGNGQEVANVFMEAVGVTASNNAAVRRLIPTMLDMYRAGLIMGRVRDLLEVRRGKDIAAGYTGEMIRKATGGRRTDAEIDTDNGTWLAVHDFLEARMNDAYKEGYIQARKDAAAVMADE